MKLDLKMTRAEAAMFLAPAFRGLIPPGQRLVLESMYVNSYSGTNEAEFSFTTEPDVPADALTKPEAQR